MKEAYLYEKLDNKKVRCFLCSHRCLIKPGSRGICGVRENADGTLTSLVYRQILAKNVDPIEKKPLYHFLPGSRSYSIATAGCNFKCLFCQNADISQMVVDNGRIWGEDTPPELIVEKALATGSSTIAYTYTEPTIYFEYAFDTAVKARQAGINNVFVTNGYTTTAALEAIAPYLDAANVDLKGFSSKAYREVTGASLEGVLDCLRDYRRLGIWLEVTTLVIPGHNDSADELRELAAFVAGELGRDVPWHISAFYPTYKMLDRPPTPAATLYQARDIGHRAGLEYVYLGNLDGSGAGDTLCPGCGQTVIRRQRLQFLDTELIGNRCRYCRHEIAGIALS